MVGKFKKKFLIIICAMITAALVLIVAISIITYSSAPWGTLKNKVRSATYSEIKMHGPDLLKAANRAMAYEPGPMFFLLDDGKTVVKFFEEDDIQEEVIPEIYKVLNFGTITEIKKNNNMVDFMCDESKFEKIVSSNFWGFYYSLDGNPHIAWKGEENESLLKKDEGGWSYVLDEQYTWYYTGKLDDNFFYYMGANYP